jgi:hypothetical protein
LITLRPVNGGFNATSSDELTTAFGKTPLEAEYNLHEAIREERLALVAKFAKIEKLLNEATYAGAYKYWWEQQVVTVEDMQAILKGEN